MLKIEFMNPRKEDDIINENLTYKCINFTIPPIVKVKNLNKNSYYSLIMYDIHAPYKESPIYSPFIHWIVINIEGKLFDDGYNYSIYKKRSTCTSIEYFPPSPPKGVHKYIFEIYEQPNKKNCIKYSRFIRRSNFSLANFDKRNCFAS